MWFKVVCMRNKQVFRNSINHIGLRIKSNQKSNFNHQLPRPLGRVEIETKKSALAKINRACCLSQPTPFI